LTASQKVKENFPYFSAGGG